MNESPLIHRNNFLLEELARLLSGGGGSAASSVSITGDTVGLNRELTQQSIQTIISNLLTATTDRTQFSRITDGTDTLAVNADGSINISVPADLVREQVPFSVENNLIDINDNVSDILNEINGGLIRRKAQEDLSFCVVRVVENSPAFGDKTTYLGYNLIYHSSGAVNIGSDFFSIKRIVEFLNGNVNISWANNNRYIYNLIFDSGLQEYLTYTY